MGYFFYILLFSLFSSTSAFFIGLKLKAFKSPYFLLWLTVFSSVIGDSIHVMAIYYYRTYNEFFYQLHVSFFYRLIEFLLLTEFFRISLSLHTKAIRIFQLSTLLYFIFIFPSVPYTGIDAVDPTAISMVNCALMVAFSIFSLIKYLKALSVQNPTNDPYFFSLAAILVYFSGITFIVLFMRFLGAIDQEASFFSYSFQNLFVVLRNVLLAIAFYKTYNQINGTRV